MNVPKLRFGEFATEERQRSTLGNLTKWSSGGTPSKENPNFWEGDIPWISASTMRGLYYSDSEVRITSEGLKNGSKLAEKGDLLLLVRGSMLFNKIPVGIAECDLAFNQDVKSLKPNPELNASYLLQWFQASEHKLLSMVVGTGIGAGKLETSDVQSIDFLLPSKKEQQKIADFLSAVDDKITFLTAQKTALTQYKQGMMQRIFSQTLRFKDDNGADYPDWKIQPIGGYLIEYKEQSVKHGEFEVLTSSNRGLIRQRDYYGENRLTERDNEGFNVIPHGYITYRSRSDNSKFTFNLNLLGITGVISVYYPVFSIHNGDNRFWVEYLNFHWKDISIYSVGTSQKVLALSALRSIKMSLPTKNEQTKIAQFLTELDDKINAVDAQIQSAQQWKQGLLQQMFV